LFIPYCLGKIVATLFISFYPEWRKFEFYLGLISISQILVVWFIPESPRWLLFHYKVEKAKKLLSTIAKVNNQDVDIDIKIVKRDKCFDMDGAEIKDDLLEISFGRPDEDVVLLKQRHYSVAKICVPETVQYTVAFLWCWPMINFLRFGLVACLQVFKDPINTSYARSCIEILGLLFTCIFEGYMGRRTALLTFLSFTTVMYFGISIRGISTTTKEFFVFIASFQSVSANILIVLYTLSVYPTSLRSKTLGFFTAWSSIGEILAPIVIDYLPYVTNSKEGAFFAMGLAALIGCCLCYYLPETLGRPLPETMDDVLYLRARNPSCCSRIKYERKKSKAKYVPVETAPRIKIPNHDWAPTEEIRLWRQQAFGVNYLNNAFNTAEIERQTRMGRR
jgi:OCT family organic cation transporter-like MFS transporter 4/5